MSPSKSEQSHKRKREGMTKPDRPPPAPGEIRRDAIYRGDEFIARMGMTASSFRSAKRRGLKTHTVGKRVYVSGADAIAFVTREARSDA